MNVGFSSLWDRVRKGDPAALDVLLARHLPALRAYIRIQAGPAVRRRESCSDLVQSACREALADLGNAHFDAEEAFRGWLFRVAWHKVLSKREYHGTQRRDIAREAAAGDGALLGVYAAVQAPSAGAIAQEEIARIEDAFDRLSPEHRDIILQVRILGRSAGEVAAETNRSEAAVRQLLHRARARLGLLLDR
jgi:RNA polymerase sigma factor (sigma-70 family)